MFLKQDVLMGTQLLYIDFVGALRLLMKKLRGRHITKREKKKIERTLADLATLIPVTILMLIPVSTLCSFSFTLFCETNMLTEFVLTGFSCRTRGYVCCN